MLDTSGLRTSGVRRLKYTIKKKFKASELFDFSEVKRGRKSKVTKAKRVRERRRERCRERERARENVREGGGIILFDLFRRIFR